MAHHKATLKAIRQNKVRTETNVARRTRLRSSIKTVDTAVENKDSKAAKDALIDAQKEMMRGVSKGVIKLKTASRKLSRLNAKVKALGDSKPAATSKKKATTATKKPSAAKKAPAKKAAPKKK